MLGFEPESVEAARARLPQALAPIYDPLDLRSGELRPGEQRRHVFDFEEGIRLIVSRDLLIDSSRPPEVHVSASAIRPADIARVVAMGQQAFVTRVFGLWTVLRGKKLRLVGFSPGRGVPHFVEEQDGPTN